MVCLNRKRNHKCVILQYNMKFLILSVVFALVKGQIDPAATNAVTCNDNHTVSIVIGEIKDIDLWTEAEWETIKGITACQPIFDPVAQTATYTNIPLPDCAKKSLEEDNNVTIKYVFEISVTAPDPSNAADQTRRYDHLYYASCTYTSNGTVLSSFTPIVNRAANDTDASIFTFEFDVFQDPAFTTFTTNPVSLNQRLYVKAEAISPSIAPNLDLFPVSCWASSSPDPVSTANKVVLIADGCGNPPTSKDDPYTLTYNCTDNDIREYFSILSFRYYGFPPAALVYFHCQLRVCLADNPTSACECPDALTCPAKRKRRSAGGEYVVEVHERAGPFYFVDDKEDEVESEEEDPSDEHNEVEGPADTEEQSQSFSVTNLAIIVSVTVVAVAICATVCFVVRSRNKRRQHGVLNVAA